MDNNIFESTPDIKISVKQTFNIDTDMTVEGFSKKNQFVPELDNAYKFDRDTTLAILAGFVFNKVWRNILEEQDIFPANYFKQFEKKTIYSSKEIEALKKLDLKSNVKWSEIREQFKKLVKKYHPDTNSGDKKFENKLKEITIAYTLLRNNQKT